MNKDFHNHDPNKEQVSKDLSKPIWSDLIWILLIMIMGIIFLNTIRLEDKTIQEQASIIQSCNELTQSHYFKQAYEPQKIYEYWDQKNHPEKYTDGVFNG